MFLLLIAGILIATSYLGDRPPPGYDPGVTLVGTVVLTAVGALSGLIFRLGVRAPVLSTPAGDLDWHRRLSRLTWMSRGLLAGSYVSIIHGFHWPVFVSATLKLKGTIAVDEVLVLAPFLTALLGALILSFPAHRRLSGESWRLGTYLVFVLRQYWGFLLVPWLLYVTVLDVMELMVAPVLPAAWRARVEWAVVIGLLAVLYAVWPLALRWLWPTRRLGDGAVRRRLEEICRQAGVRFREMLVWRSPLGGVANAAVAGVAGPTRYILLTETLLERLEPEEVEAVLSHELGHVLKGHIPYYVLLALTFVALAVLADAWLGGGIPEPVLTAGAEGSILDLVVAAAVVGVYWGVLFGWLSRRFEREADLVAADMVGDAELFAGALEKIARINGRPPDRPGWRHFSVAQRTRFLRESSRQPELRRRALAVAQVIRRLLLVGTLTAVSAMALCFWLL